MTKDDLLNIRRNLIGALKVIEKQMEGKMGFNKGRWNSKVQGTYEKAKHGEIGSRKNLTK